MEETNQTNVSVYPDDGRNIRPYLTIWTKARKIIPALVVRKQIWLVILFVWLTGILNELNLAMKFHLGDHADTYFLIGYTIGQGLFGVIVWLIISGAILLFGKLLKGTATYREILDAFGWAQIPLLVILFISRPIGFLIFGEEIFTSESVYLSTPMYVLHQFTVILDIVMVIWYVIILSQAIGAVQKFSSWKGFFNILLAGIILFILMIAYMSNRVALN